MTQNYLENQIPVIQYFKKVLAEHNYTIRFLGEYHRIGHDTTYNSARNAYILNNNDHFHIEALCKFYHLPSQFIADVLLLLNNRYMGHIWKSWIEDEQPREYWKELLPNRDANDFSTRFDEIYEAGSREKDLSLNLGEILDRLKFIDAGELDQVLRGKKVLSDYICGNRVYYLKEKTKRKYEVDSEDDDMKVEG